MVVSDAGSEEGRLLQKAINLFTFLGQTQQLLLKPVRTVDRFEKAIWFGALPEHPAIRSAHRTASPEAESPLLTVERVGRLDPPPLPEELWRWIDREIQDPENEPALRESLHIQERQLISSDSAQPRVELVDFPEVVSGFETWLADWRLWAERERRDAVVRGIYKDLFALRLQSTDHSEEFELVLGVGCLSWRPAGHEQVQRHTATAPVAVTFDESTGTLTVAQVAAPESVTIEVDMLDTGVVAAAKIDEIRQLAAEYDEHLLDRVRIGDICRRLIHRLDPDAEYDEDALDAALTAAPRGSFAPALILRRRTNRGLVQIYDSIVAQLRSTEDVPTGILPLIDPDRQPEAEPDTRPGAVVSIGPDDFLPLPVNEQQRRIIDRVDTTAQTVVQGPPGTGKTHTAAALVSHLLAKGLRVLITAQTDRALQEVRDKLPREIQSLAVSVIGQSRSDMADLRTAVDNISRRADEFDIDDSRNAIKRHLAKIEELGRRRAEAYNRLIAIRRQEVETRSDGPVAGTLAAIAYQHLQDEHEYCWIREFDVDPSRRGTSISTAEITRWRSLLLDRDLVDNEEEASQRLPQLSEIPTPTKFAELVGLEQQAVSKKDSFENLLAHESFEFVRQLSPELREELRSRVSDLAGRASELEKRGESWINDALSDVRSGRQQTWHARSAQVKALADEASALISRYGVTTTVTVEGGDPAVHQQIAKSLFAHVNEGNRLKVQPDGTPKIGAFASKVVKAAGQFFAQVKVNGLPATSAEQLGRFIDWVETSRIVAAMDQAWPINVEIPDEDTYAEKVQWHRTEVAQLDKVLALGDRVEDERAWFDRNGLPVPDWNNLDAIRRYATLVEAATAADDATTSTAPLEDIIEQLRAQETWSDRPSVTSALREAVQDRDLTGYSAAHQRLSHLHAVAAKMHERNRIRVEIDDSAPRLAQAIVAEPDSADWDTRLSTYNEAWRWEMTGRWILAQDSEDSNALKVELNAVEEQIRGEVKRLAAERAWQHAVAPGRLTGSARANLTQYAQLVASLGKGMGKYAPKKRVEIAEAMDRCRPSVPVWIMPIYRIAEQMRVEPNLFDVVVVDEASQAGLEASFLQYLAPKIVVIGDDKQVSPSAVGVDQQQLRDLANIYLTDDPYKASWLDPKRSYFDEASMRFGGRITLIEHRRCVPEIIGFSNRIAYEPQGIRLVPVRQFGAERLEPIKVVHLMEGEELNNRTNPVEARAIVDQITECLEDPRYDGATIGVISLLGKEQARLIERELLDSLTPEEWTARQLRCGDASDFQGSERDVIFLSMVKAPNEDRRLTALTAIQYVQRFNVAASRAKDQMWVYHSMPREALFNTEDMRFQLLDYCYNVVNRPAQKAEISLMGSVSEDVLVPPFDSIFEQRVFNRVVERGYEVRAQHEALGYNIDLVIIGAKSRLAIECDGDFWRGAEHYEADLARQRELERCGWEFFRIRESQFYADMPGVLQRLWDTLDELGIRTADWNGEDEERDDSEPDDELKDAKSELLPVDRSRAFPRLAVIPELTPVAIPEPEAGGDWDGALPDWDEFEIATSEHIEVACDAQSRLGQQQPADTSNGNVANRIDVEIPLPPYREFDGALPTITETPLEAMVANVVRIVQAEGPVVGHRLHHVYVKAAGGQRVGREIARLLNRAIETAERQGLIISENPFNEPGIKPKTFRLYGQPSVSPRKLGARALEMVPPAELALHLAELGVADGSMTEEELFREVLTRLGLKRLTDNARSVLQSAMALVPKH